MASFRIHEDQENRVSEFRQKINANAPQQQKRAVLTALENRIEHRVKGKQPLGDLNVKKVDENAYKKQNTRKLPPPVVPVAQFEAFKVYEDNRLEEDELEKELKERQRRRKDKDSSFVVYKGTDEDQFVTKKQVIEMKAKLKQEQAEKVKENAKLPEPIPDPIPKVDSPLSSVDLESPMSIEKSLLQECIIEKLAVVIQRPKYDKDAFFEMQEYRTDIYRYLREHELQNRPKPGYMKKQPDITYNMRTILVDWLVEVAEEYKLQSETLYLAVNYIDRFLSYMSVVRAKLQLVGTAAMFIAAKYEEICPPDVGEFVYITDDTYNKKQVIRMEHLILKVLSFDLSVPTPLTFITAICISNQFDDKIMYLAMYISELAMLEADRYLESLPSLIAASSIAIARHTLEEAPWNAVLRRTTGYELTDLKKTIEFLSSMFNNAVSFPQQAIQEKYKLSKYLHVSLLNPRDDINFELE